MLLGRDGCQYDAVVVIRQHGFAAVLCQVLGGAARQAGLAGLQGSLLHLLQRGEHQLSLGAGQAGGRQMDYGCAINKQLNNNS